MEKVIQNRLKELDEISIFVKNVENEALMILQSLGWSSEKIHNENAQIFPKLQCPLDSGHYIPPGNISNHYKKCKLAKNGYDKDELLLPENCNTASKTVIIDPLLRGSILAQAAEKDVNFNRGVQNLLDDPRPTPLSADRITSTFTRDERRALYDFVISNAPAENVTSDGHLMTKDNVSQKSQIFKSLQEELAETRDLKRRRTKYKVTTKSKAYTEIIRDVIDSQMASYVDILKEKIKNDAYKGKSFITKSNENDSKRVSIKSNKFEVISQKGKQHEKRESYEDDKHHRSHDRSGKRHSHQDKYKSHGSTNKGHSNKDSHAKNNINSTRSREEERNKKKSKHRDSNYTSRDSFDKHEETSVIPYSHREESREKYDKQKKLKHYDSSRRDDYLTNRHSHKDMLKPLEDQQIKYKSCYHFEDYALKYNESHPHSSKEVPKTHEDQQTKYKSFYHFEDYALKDNESYPHSSKEVLKTHEDQQTKYKSFYHFEDYAPKDNGSYPHSSKEVPKTHEDQQTKYKSFYHFEDYALKDNETYPHSSKEVPKTHEDQQTKYKSIYHFEDYAPKDNGSYPHSSKEVPKTHEDQ